MPKELPLRFVYLTLPDQNTPILNINSGGEHSRFHITRDQLYDLNKQIADTLVRRSISAEHSFDEQLVLNLELPAATL